MAQFLKAKFLSQALEWKTRFPGAKFYAGLRYEPFIFQQARKVFPDYNRLYPDNKEFTQKLIRDLRNKNEQLLKIINPQTITPEQQTANIQFETQAQIEQQQVAQVSQQPAPQPFSFQSAQSIPRMPLSMPSAGTTLNLPSRVTEPEPPVGPAIAKGEQLKQAVAQQPPTIPLRTATVNPGLRFKPGFANTLKNFGSAAGRFFQRNVGKFLTAGRIGTAVSAGIGAITGGALTHGSAIGIFGGGGLGAVAPSWIKSGGGARFLTRAGNGAINVGVNISNQVSRGATRFSMSGGSKKWAVGLLGILLFFAIGAGLLGGLPGNTPPGPTPPGGTDISSCKFTRAGNPQLIKSSILAGWISSATTTTGIPPAVLASVAMHESQDFVANADNNHDAIKTNQYCNKSKLFCVKADNSGPLHQDPKKDDPCTQAELDAGNKTAQAVGLMQFLDIYNPGKDLCSITESLTLAAAKLKADGLTSQPTQDQINQAIHSYYNSCEYGSYSYCNEVWQDLQNCQSQSSTVPPGLAGIISAAGQIVSLLYQTNPASSLLEDRLFHNKRDEPGVYYWCTYLIIDAYNAAGFSGLTRSAHGGVMNMIMFFANTPGYQLLSSSTLVEQLRPGDVIFFEGPSGQHASLVKSVDVSQEGNGVIRTYESNNVVTEDIVFVQNHQATVAQTTSKTYAIAGFGQIKS